MMSPIIKEIDGNTKYLVQYLCSFLFVPFPLRIVNPNKSMQCNLLQSVVGVGSSDHNVLCAAQSLDFGFYRTDNLLCGKYSSANQNYDLCNFSINALLVQFYIDDLTRKISFC